jgi:hypothetical protein
MDMSIGEAVGLAAGILAALGLASFLVTTKLRQAGLGGPERRQVLVSLWLLVLGLIALLFALRALSGGPVVAGSPSSGVWLGLQPRQVVALLLAVALLVGGYMRLRRLLEPLEAAATGVAAPPPSTPPTDEEEL